MSFGIPVRNGVMLGLTASTALSTRGGFPVPALSLDFLSGTLDSRITFTRALDTATRVNSNGFIETVNANIPRFDYDPVTLQPRGLLVEEARSNFILQSNTLTSNADATVTANAATSPDGTANAYRITKANATDPVYSSKTTSMTVAANTAYTVSRFVKYDVYNTTVSLEYNNTNNWGGTAWYAFFSVTSTGVTVSLVNSCTATVTNFGNGWYRLTATFTTGGTITTPSNPSILLRITGGSGVTVLGYGVQLEAGAFATSYIPTTTTSLTRNADGASMTGANFSSWYNQSEGTFVINIQKLSPSSVATYAYEVTGATSSFSMRVRLGTDARMQSVDGGAVQVDAQLASSTQTTPSKYAMAYRLNDYAGSANGAAAVLDASATVPAISSLSLGSVAVTNMYLRTFTYFSLRLPNDRLPALTR